MAFTLVLLASFLHLAIRTSSAAALSSYNVDPNLVSVSGLSAGGFMAAQLGVAYSEVFKTGFGVFAGGPFDCARNQYYTECMYDQSPSITQSIANVKSWSGKHIAPLGNLKNRQIYMQVGTADYVVGQNPMKQLKSQLYTFADATKVSFVTSIGAAHVFPTDFDGPGDNTCGQSTSPYISNCGYDGAGAVLSWMYGNLAARDDGAATGTTISFDQTAEFGAPGMDGTGYLYLPKTCQTGAKPCKLHVALHGCLQSYGHIGTQYIENTGFIKWADTNDIIVLFPQAATDYVPRMIWTGLWLPNPNACFDWVGWYGSNADLRGGVQMAAIVNQVNMIASGFKGY